MGKIKISKEQKEEILNISYRYTSVELSKMYNCSKSLILKIWKDNGYVKGKNNIYYVNEHYFKNIDTANKAYVLGFIASDGNIYKRDSNHSGQLQIKLKYDDEKILRDILKDMDSTYPVKHVCNCGYEQVLFTIVNETIYNDLNKIGLKENKTWNINLEEVLKHIPQVFHIDFIRGYLDGDGTIGFIKDKRISNVEISFACPYKFGLQLQKILLENYNIESSVSIDTRKYTHTFCSVYIKHRFRYMFLKILYLNNANLCLERKYQRALNFINAVESNSTNRKENIISVEIYNNFLVAGNGNTDKVRNGGFGSTGTK